MIKNISLENSIKLIGHERGTTTKEISLILFGETRKLKRGFPKNYSLCKVSFSNAKNAGHWVLYKDQHIYDPVIGRYVHYDNWKDIKAGIKGVWNKMKITSYLEL